MAQLGGALAPWFTREFLSQRKRCGARLPTESVKESRRGQLLRLTGTTKRGDDDYVWGELSDGEQWIDCCFPRTVVDAFALKSTRTIGACSANKATLRLRSWRFVFAVPPQPPQSPSKHRNKSTDTIYKSARICLAVGAFEFFADGDGQTLLTLNGSRDVLEWRRNAGAEVTRWVEEIEGGKKGTVSGEGGKGKVKAVVYDSELSKSTIPRPSSFKPIIAAVAAPAVGPASSSRTSSTGIDWSRAPPPAPTNTKRWWTLEDKHWTPEQKAIMAEKKQKKGGRAVATEEEAASVAPSPKRASASPPKPKPQPSKWDEVPPPASSRRRATGTQAPSTSKPQTRATEPLPPLPPANIPSPQHLTVLPSTRPMDWSAAPPPAPSSRRRPPPPPVVSAPPATEPPSSPAFRIPPSSPPVPPNALPLPTSRQDVSSRCKRADTEQYWISPVPPAAKEVVETDDDDEDELEALRAGQGNTLDQSYSTSHEGDQTREDEDAEVAALLTQPSQVSHFNSSSYAASSVYSPADATLPSAVAPRSSPRSSKADNSSPKNNTRKGSFVSVSPLLHRPAPPSSSPRPARVAASPPKKQLSEVDEEPFPFPILSTLPPSPAASIVLDSPAPPTPISATSSAFPSTRRAPRASLQAVAVAHRRSLVSTPSSPPAPSEQEAVPPTDQVVEVRWSQAMEDGPLPQPSRLSEKAKGKQRAEDQDRLFSPEPAPYAPVKQPDDSSAPLVRRLADPQPMQPSRQKKKRRFSLLDPPAPTSSSHSSSSSLKRRRRTTLGLGSVLHLSPLGAIDGSLEVFERLRKEVKKTEALWEAERQEMGRLGREWAEEELSMVAEGGGE